MAPARVPKAAPPPPDAPSHIRDLTPDPDNRRTHGPRNVGFIVESLHAVGAARSIVIDEDGRILAGNATVDAAAEAGITKVRVIDATGNELIAVRRRGLSEPQKRQLAIADNRAAELATWNLEQLAADADAGLDLLAWWRPEELEALFTPLVAAADAPPESDAAAGGEPGAPRDDVRAEQYGVLVVCGSEEEQDRVYKELVAEGRICKAVRS